MLADEAGDDATASLAMILRYHRRTVTLSEVHQALVDAAGERRSPAVDGEGAESAGFDALAVSDAAAHFGLLMRALQIGHERHLSVVGRPAILHMRQPGDVSLPSLEVPTDGYFAVLTTSLEPNELHWIDPYVGQRRNTSRTLFGLCTGVILQFSRAQPLPSAVLTQRSRS